MLCNANAVQPKPPRRELRRSSIRHSAPDRFYVFNFTKKFRTQSSKSNTRISSTMSKAHPPELKKLMDKRLAMKLNGNRSVNGILRGFDPFMNIVLDETIEDKKDGTKQQIGMVVIRGNSIIMMEVLDRVPMQL